MGLRRRLLWPQAQRVDVVRAETAYHCLSLGLDLAQGPRPQWEGGQRLCGLYRQPPGSGATAPCRMSRVSALGAGEKEDSACFCLQHRWTGPQVNGVPALSFFLPFLLINRKTHLIRSP